MLSEYNRGVRSSCIFYCCVMLMVAVTHVVAGWENFSLWPRSGLVIIPGILVSLVWICVNVINLFSPISRERNYGEAIVHGIALSAAAIFTLINQV